MSFSGRSVDQNWTEIGVDLTPRDEVLLSVPPGEWFVFASWEAWIQKETDIVSESGSAFEFRLVLEQRRQPIRRWKWGASLSVLTTPDDDADFNNSVSVGDSGAAEIETEARFTTLGIRIETAVTPPGEHSDTIVSGSVLQAIAVRRP
jgi:hypothetical protein